MAANDTTYIGIPCKKMAPTRKHRPAIWEAMLGTVEAMNEAGEVRYFDYDHAGAKAWAGVAGKQDVRVARVKVRYQGWPPRGRLTLWVERA